MAYSACVFVCVCVRAHMWWSMGWSTEPVEMQTHGQNWTHVTIATGPMHWNTGPNPSPWSICLRLWTMLHNQI
jgi:hypothetical protein